MQCPSFYLFMGGNSAGLLATCMGKKMKLKKVICTMALTGMVVGSTVNTQGLVSVNAMAPNLGDKLISMDNKKDVVEDYINIYQKVVKIGNYYYRIKTNTGELQRRKKGNKSYKTIVTEVWGRCLATTSKIYYMKPIQNENNGYCEVYSCKLNGTKKTKMKKLSCMATLANFYNKKLYVTAEKYNQSIEENEYSTYAISNYGKGSIKKEVLGLNLYSAYKQYMAGTLGENTGEMGEVCIYNAKTKETVMLGIGCKPIVIKKKVYYVSWDSEENQYTVKRCDLKGENVTEMTPIEEEVSHVEYVGNSYVEYYAKDKEELQKLAY